MANVVEIVVRARDAASGPFAGAAAGIGRGLAGITRRAMGMIAPLGQAALKVAALGQAALAVGPLVAKGAMAVGQVAKAAGQAAPALVAFGVAGKILAGTLKMIFAEGSAMRAALQPIADGIKKAGENASAAAARGVRPLAEAFNRAAFPTINKFMVAIGETVNDNTKFFLGWAKSTAGIKTLKNILEPISKAFKDLGPSVTGVAISFAQMLGRIMGVSMAAGSSGLTGVLDKLNQKMDAVNADTVSAGLDKLKSAASGVWNALTAVADVVRKAADAYRTYQTEFSAVADVIALAAIAFGGPVAAIAGAVGLVIRHWDQLKAAYQEVVDYFSKSPQGVGFIDNLRSAAETVLPRVKEAFQQIWEKIGPVLRQIGGVIKDELIPAFGQFLAAAAPVARWFVGVLGPFVATTMENILNIVRGVLDILVGIFKFFTGVLTGDWSKAWQGIVQVLGGIGEILAALLSQIWANILALWRIGLETVKQVTLAAVDAVLSFFEMLGSKAKALVTQLVEWIIWPFKWLYNALVGGSIIPDLVNGIVGLLTSLGTSARQIITSMINTVVGFFRDMMSRAVGAISGGVGAVSGAVGRVKNTITGFFSGAVDWLVEAGKNIIRGLIRGITSMGGAVGDAVGGVVRRARNLLPFSPAKEGPLSGAGAPDVAGAKMIQMVAEGVRSQAAGLRAAVSGALAASGLARPPGAGGVPPPARASGGGAVVLELRSSGARVDDLLVELLRGAIRVRGGGVTAVLGG